VRVRNLLLLVRSSLYVGGVWRNFVLKRIYARSFVFGFLATILNWPVEVGVWKVQWLVAMKERRIIRLGATGRGPILPGPNGPAEN